MDIKEIRQRLINEGANPDNFLILPIQQGFQLWQKQYAPTYMKSTDEIRLHDVGEVKVASQHATKRLVIEGVLNADELTELVQIYDDWDIDIPYETDDLFTHEGKFYKVLPPGHTSQADWIPGVGTESLYTPIAVPGEIEEWGTRNLTTNPFMLGEQVRFEGVVYESTIDNNAWTPTDYPSGWKVV